MDSNSGTPSRQHTADPDVVVKDFLRALADGASETAGGLLTDDVWWENVGLPVLHGKYHVLEAIRAMNRKCQFDFRIHHLAVETPQDPTDAGAPIVVLTERTDYLGRGRFRCGFWVCGRLEVRDGKICGWRDYFSVRDMAVGAVRGLLGMVRTGGARR